MASDNRKIAYTKNALKEALRDLLTKKPIDQITVTELCRCANINRTTFYKYYTIPADILVELRDTLVQHVDQSNSAVRTNMYGLALGWCNAIFKDINDWKMLSYGNADLQHAFMQPDDSWLSYFKIKKGLAAEDASFLFKFMFYGTSGLTSDWIKQKDPEPPEVFAERIAAVMKLFL